MLFPLWSRHHTSFLISRDIFVASFRLTARTLVLTRHSVNLRFQRTETFLTITEVAAILCDRMDDLQQANADLKGEIMTTGLEDPWRDANTVAHENEQLRTAVARSR